MNLKMKEIRISRGYKQEEVAKKAEMPLRRYGSYEREERVVSLIDAAKIADVLECSLDELVGREWPKGAFNSKEREIIGNYRDTHDFYKPEIEHFAEDLAKRHPKSEAPGDAGRQMEKSA